MCRLSDFLRASLRLTKQRQHTSSMLWIYQIDLSTCFLIHSRNTNAKSLQFCCDPEHEKISKHAFERRAIMRCYGKSKLISSVKMQVMKHTLWTWKQMTPRKSPALQSWICSSLKMSLVSLIRTEEELYMSKLTLFFKTIVGKIGCMIKSLIISF